MFITVCSPLRRTGTTTVSTFVANALSTMLNKITLLTNLNLDKNDLNKLTGIVKDPDKIDKSITQLSCLIDSNRITYNEIPAYCEKINNNLMLYSSIPTNVSDSEILKLWKSFYNTLDNFSYKVTDLDVDINSELAQTILEISNVVIIVVNHDDNSILAAKKFKETLIAPDQNIRTSSNKERPVIYVVNNYNPIIENTSKIAQKLGVRTSEVVTVSQNVMIQKYSLKGALPELIHNHLSGKSFTVPSIKNDLRGIARVISPKDLNYAEKERRNRRR